MAIGICDWGIGGVGLLQMIRRRSKVNIHYFSDTGFTPYGKTTTDELTHRLTRVFDFLFTCGATHIAVGCNAASTVLQPHPNITGVIEHGIQLVVNTGVSAVGVAGGKRTVETEVYKKALEELGIQVIQSIAQPLSARIETGDLNSPELKKDIQEIFSPFHTVQHILLACTHYPLISQAIHEQTQHTKILLDPVPAMCTWIFDHWDIPDEESMTTFYTSGDADEMKHSLYTLYQIEANNIKKSSL